MSDKLEKIRQAMFDIKPVELTAKELEIKTRYMDLYTQMLSHSFKPDSHFVKYLDESYGIQKTQAYKDIAAVKILLGDVKNAGKEYQRYAAIEMIKKGAELADREDADRTDIKRWELLVRAGMALGKVTRLDKEDVEKLPWDEIVPQSFEVTGDVSVLGRKKIPDLERRKAALRKELFGDVDPKYQDAEIIEDE